MDMTEIDLDTLLARFLEGSMEAADFPHENHVKVSWALARRYPEGEAHGLLRDGIRGIASRAGSPGAYHETITKAWFRLILSAQTLEDWPELFDKRLINRYYSAERLAAGRENWLEPDLHPLELPPPPPIEAPSIRDVLRRVPVAVAVLTVRADHDVHATTTSSLTSISSDPPLVGVCLTNQSRALALVQKSGRFAISVLAAGQDGLASRFADPARPAGPAQFASVPHHMGEFGPLIDATAASLGCEVHALHRCGDHHLLIGEIRVADASTRRPLVRHDGSYH